ncbi:hypothetical protein ABPG72_007411 [Tetrahymena utriculariae]
MGNDIKKAYELYNSFKSKMLLKENIFTQEDREKKMYFHQDSAYTMKDEDLEKNTNKNQQNFQQTRRLKRMDYEDENLKKTVYNLQMTPSYRNKTIMEILYLRKDGSITMTRIYRDMLQLEVTYTLNGKKFFVKNDIKEFENKDSRFFKCLQGIAARDLIKNDFKACSIYNYLKYYAKKKFSYAENDWYKIFVDIKSTNKKDKYNQQVPFSDVQIKEDMINRVFMDLSIRNQKGQKLDSIQSLGINSHLIRQNLYSDALGIVVDTESFIQPCVGESLHLEFFQVHSVEAFKQINLNKNQKYIEKQKMCGKKIDWIGLHVFWYVKKYDSSSLAQIRYQEWCFDFRRYSIQYTDKDQLLIRIYDEDLYICQQFFLNIVDEYNAEKDNFELADDFNLSEIINLIINQESQSDLRFAVDKNQSKASQFKTQNQNFQRLMDQDYFIDRSSTNAMLKSIQQQSPLLVLQDSKQDYVDELFLVQNKEIITAPTTNRQMIDQDVSSYSQRNQQELDKTQADADVSYTAMRNQIDNHYNQKDIEGNTPQD